jgi:hypothetical protein
VLQSPETLSRFCGDETFPILKHESQQKFHKVMAPALMLAFFVGGTPSASL